jgi:hypothetical protein
MRTDGSAETQHAGAAERPTVSHPTTAGTGISRADDTIACRTKRDAADICMHAVRARQASANIQELADPHVAGQVSNGTASEIQVLAHCAPAQHRTFSSVSQSAAKWPCRPRAGPARNILPGCCTLLTRCRRHERPALLRPGAIQVFRKGVAKICCALEPLVSFLGKRPAKDLAELG